MTEQNGKTSHQPYALKGATGDDDDDDDDHHHNHHHHHHHNNNKSQPFNIILS
jgi:hypothetical protein